MNEVELKNILGKLEYKSVYKRYTSSNRFQYFMSISESKFYVIFLNDFVENVMLKYFDHCYYYGYNIRT